MNYHREPEPPLEPPDEKSRCAICEYEDYDSDRFVYDDIACVIRCLGCGEAAQLRAREDE